MRLILHPNKTTNKMSKTASHTFVLSDESLNSHGTRILLSGIRLEGFKKNPIMLYGHTRAWRDTKNIQLPIGYWDNIRMDEGRLLADAVFDREDEFARSVESKVRQNILRACSIGINVLATSEDPVFLVIGQRRPTIVECELAEASIVDIPANRNCVRLYDAASDMELDFSADADNFLLPLLTDRTKTNDNMDFKQQVLKALGLSDGLSDEQALAEIVKAQAPGGADLAEHDRLKAELQGYREREAAAQKKEREAYIAAAVSERKITESEKPHFLSLAEKDFESVKSLLDGRKGVADLSDPSVRGDTAADPWAARLEEIEKNKLK